MELSNIKNVYLVGVGGIGMSALARYFVHRGCAVFGYDKTQTKLTESLTKEGISISYIDDISVLPPIFLDKREDSLVVYTPAVPQHSIILNYFINKGFELKKRSKVLGMISEGMFCIAVAGTHGKTTTSSILAHILTHTGYGCTAFLGGIATNYNSNLLLSKNNVVVIEADEYDRSFLTLYPDIAMITSMDADHLDIYSNEQELQNSFKQFASQLKEEGKLFVKNGLPLQGITYSLGKEAMVQSDNIRVKQGKFIFDFNDGYTKINDLELGLPGKHNVENTTVAIAVALSLGIAPKAIKKAVASFKGVKRRFETIFTNDNCTYIDDYAHHPQELKKCFEAVRALFPNRKMTVIFQPHLFTRTRDFADDFASVLSTVDELLLLDIYPARELPIEGVTAQMLLDKITITNKEICEKDKVVERVMTLKPDLLLTVGAGDIDTLIDPLKKLAYV